MYGRKSKLQYIFLLPTFLILLLFSYLPITYGVYLSFHQVMPGNGTMEFVGMKNYRMILQQPDFWSSMVHTLVYVLGTTFVIVIAGLILSVILNSKPWGSTFYMTVLFIPWVLSDVVVGSTWSWLFNPDMGVLKYIFSPFHFDPSILLNDPQYAMIGVILASLWKMLAYNTILLLAGMQSISHDYLEAAKLDGCSSRQTFQYITFPIMAPTIITVALLSIINCISQAGIILVLTNGGPLTSTQTLAFLLYKEAFINFNMNAAPTISMMLAVINIAVVLIYLRLTAKKTVEM